MLFLQTHSGRTKICKCAVCVLVYTQKHGYLVVLIKELPEVA